MEAAAERNGKRMLEQIEETNLGKILTTLRAKPENNARATNPFNPPLWKLNPNYTDPATWKRPPKYRIRPPPKVVPIAVLNALVVRHYRATHGVPLGMRGRFYPLLYLLLATLIAPPNNKAVLVVDLEERFDISRVLEYCPVSMLPLPPEKQTMAALRERGHRIRPPYHRPVLPSDISHIYVIRPPDAREGPLCRAILAAKQYMLYGQHHSRDRDFWGTVLIGADDPGADVDVVCDTMKCWLKVVRQPMRTLGQVGVKSCKEALVRRDAWQQKRDSSPLMAKCVWGKFKFDARGLLFPGRRGPLHVRVGGARPRRARRAAACIRSRIHVKAKAMKAASGSLRSPG